MCRRLRQAGEPIFAQFNASSGEWGGRVSTVTLTGTDGSVDVSGDDFRSLLGLYSTWSTIRVS